MGAGGRGAAPPGLACPPPDPNHRQRRQTDPVRGLGLAFTGTEAAVCSEKPGPTEPCASDQPGGGGRREGGAGWIKQSLCLSESPEPVFSATPGGHQGLHRLVDQAPVPSSQGTCPRN